MKSGDAFCSSATRGSVAQALEHWGFKAKTLGLDAKNVSTALPKALKTVDLVFNLCDTLGGGTGWHRWCRAPSRRTA